MDGAITAADLVDIHIACRELGGADKPITRATLYRGIREGRYPRPIKIGPKASRWLLPELRATRARQIAARNAS